MRRLLLASAAAIGGISGCAGGQAVVQSTTTVSPLLPTWTEAPMPTAPRAIAGANSNLSAQGFYASGPNP